MGGPAPVNWDEVEVPAVEDAVAQAAVEGTDVESGLSESFDSAGKVEAAAEVPAVSVAPAPAPAI